MRPDFHQAVHSLAARHTAWLHAEREKAERDYAERIDDRIKQRREELREAGDVAHIVAVVMASEDAIARFERQLDLYDTTTIEALQANAEELDAAAQARDEMLEKAHVLPDGRRVFRTEDGTAVFDEHGKKLSDETISPHAINRSRPSWEAFDAVVQDFTTLTEERTELLAYQEQLDEMRERLERGEVTAGELDDFERSLSGGAPSRVRELLNERDKGPAMDNARFTQGIGRVGPSTTVGPELDLDL